jgi:heat shock protein HslJ
LHYLDVCTEKIMKTRATVAAFVVTVAICTGPVNAAEQDIRATNWIVVGLAEAGKIDSTRTSFVISDDGKVTTTIGCNRMMGTAKVEGTEIAIGAIAATRMACPEPLMRLERAWGAALEAARSFKIDGDALWLFDGNGAELAALRTAADIEPK